MPHSKTQSLFKLLQKGDEGAAVGIPFKMIIIIANGIVYFLEVPYLTARLDERYYGELQGLNKAESAVKFGQEQVQLWRRMLWLHRVAKVWQIR